MAGNLTMEERARLLALTPADVESVYSGKSGHCCCGCSGNHRYHRKYRAIASKRRGYPVGDKEINDVQVRRVLGIVQKNAEQAEAGGTYFSVGIGERLYIAYLLTE